MIEIESLAILSGPLVAVDPGGDGRRGQARVSILVFSGVTVKFAVDFSQVGVGDVSVDFGGGDVAVSEQFLDGANVRPGTQKIRGERMTEGVGVDILGNSRFGGRSRNNPLHGAGREAQIFFFRMSPSSATVANKQGRIGIVSFGQVLGQSRGGPFGEKNRSSFAAFAQDTEGSFSEIGAVSVQGNQLGDTQAGGKKSLDYGPIAQSDDTVPGESSEQSADFFRSEEINFARRTGTDGNFFRRKGRNVFARQVAQESAQGDKMIILGGFAQIFSVNVGQAVQIKSPTTHQFGGYFFGSVYFRPEKKAQEVSFVVLNRGQRSFSKKFQIFQVTPQVFSQRGGEKAFFFLLERIVGHTFCARECFWQTLSN